MPRQPMDLTGKEFDRLTVEKLHRHTAKDRWWMCLCSCGKRKPIRQSLLNRGVRSCGCLSRDKPRRFPLATGKTKICSRCEKRRRLRFFFRSKSSKDGYSQWCRGCSKAAVKVATNKRKDSGLLSYGQVETRKLRVQVLTFYSVSDKPQCECCGETRIEFLALDHKNGGGNRHRKSLGGNQMVYREVRRLGFPDGYRVLCHNCNTSLGHYGYCPHQKSG